MKGTAFTIVLTFLTACSASRHTSIDSFWTDFQQAIANNDREAVADMTIFPLFGAEGYVENFDTLGITREQFLQHFDQIFDEKAKANIAKTAASELEQYTSPKDAALKSIALPTDSKVYFLNILYVFDEGMETQTESSVGFYFLKDKGIFKLAYIAIAG